MTDHPNEPAAEAHQRRLPKLRIAWSVGCGIACVLLVVLWVRSYWHMDVFVFGGAPPHGITISSLNGGVTLLYSLFRDGDVIELRLWAWSQPVSIVQTLPGFDEACARFHVRQFLGGFEVVLPHWFVVGIVATFTSVPWLRWRFSLRTLLIATTLIAVVLGIIVWKVRLPS
jgi:hypothetical protein